MNFALQLAGLRPFATWIEIARFYNSNLSRQEREIQPWAVFGSTNRVVRKLAARQQDPRLDRQWPRGAERCGGQLVETDSQQIENISSIQRRILSRPCQERALK